MSSISQRRAKVLLGILGKAGNDLCKGTEGRKCIVFGDQRVGCLEGTVVLGLEGRSGKV